MLLPLLLFVTIAAPLVAVLLLWERTLRPPPPPPTEFQLAVARLSKGISEIGRVIAEALTPALRDAARAMRIFHDAYIATEPPIGRGDRAVIAFATWFARIRGIRA